MKKVCAFFGKAASDDADWKQAEVSQQYVVLSKQEFNFVRHATATVLVHYKQANTCCTVAKRSVLPKILSTRAFP